MEIRRLVRNCLEKRYDSEYRKKVKHRQTDYATWASELCNGQKEEHSLAGIVFVEREQGRWALCAKERIAGFFAENPNALMVYGDEDVILTEKANENGYGHPWLKPDWSPDTFMWKDYLGAAFAVRESLYEKLTEEEKAFPDGGAYRLLELAGAFRRGNQSVHHLDGICFHRTQEWGQREEDSQADRESRGKKAFAVTDEGDRNELVSIIIPSKDNAEVLMRCIHTVLETVPDTAYEIVIVDNGSGSHAKEKIEQGIREIENDKLNNDLIKRSNIRGIEYLYKPMEFHFSRMCNMGADRAKGNLLLFLNDDIECPRAGWLEQMKEKAVQPWTGAVGIKLWYPDTNRIQHAGITNIGIGPVHKLQFLKDNKSYYSGRNQGVWNVLAVTGACLMVEREKFELAGGFSEELRVAFNDVDLCFNLYELGYHNAVINTTHLLHHESLSRGADESEEKLKRLLRERTELYRRHPKLEGRDPYYSKGLNRNALDTRIVPAYEEGRLIPDTSLWKRAALPAKARRDECLLVRIEYADEGHIQGYGVVLGSDNGCYKNSLLLEPKENPEQLLQIDYTEQYRGDLEENMPEQINIALGGFVVSLAAPLPKGEYRVGVLARDRISGTTLYNWSNRRIYVGKEEEAQKNGL